MALQKGTEMEIYLRPEEAIATLASLKATVLRTRTFLIEYDKQFDEEMNKIHRDHIRVLKIAHQTIFAAFRPALERVAITEIDDHIIDHRPLQKGE